MSKIHKTHFTMPEMPWKEAPVCPICNESDKVEHLFADRFRCDRCSFEEHLESFFVGKKEAQEFWDKVLRAKPGNYRR